MCDYLCPIKRSVPQGLSVCTCIGLLSSGQLSQASPTPSLSLSVCIGFGTFGQLSRTLGIPGHKAIHQSCLMVINDIHTALWLHQFACFCK